MSDDRSLLTPHGDERARRSGRSAAIVGAGILLSRVAGLGREVVLRRWLGTTTDAADAFGVALIIPKLMQNLLGEGSLSASFIPVYARLVEDDEEKEAGRVAGAVFSMLAVLTGLLVATGLFLADPLARIVAPGFAGAKLDLTADLLRITVTGIGFIVLAAWCLGVLNAHRKFFLSYVAPVVWNVAIIGFVVFAGLRSWAIDDIALAAAWGVLCGGLAQFLIQLPAVIRIAPSIRLGFGRSSSSVRTVVRRFGPAVAGRGVVTLSTYLDVFLASLLATGAVAALGAAQILYLLPISAFALSVAAVELPELSRSSDSGRKRAAALRLGLERISLFLVFSLAIYLFIGKEIVAALYERGETDADDVLLIWLVLAVYSLGMPASGASRLLQNARFAAGDVSGPARIAALRVLVAAVVGVVAMLQFDRFGIVDGEIQRLGDLPAFSPLPQALRQSGVVRLGAVGLAVGASLGAWLELVLLQRRTAIDVPDAPKARSSIAPLLVPALVAGVVGLGVVVALGSAPSIIAAGVACALAGVVYFVGANLAGNRAAVELMSPLLKRL
jgi:putative peptidoglycan lipid II flippase